VSAKPGAVIQNPQTAIAAVKLLLASRSPARLAMQGTSMLPLLHEPMVLELAPINGRLRAGDIVVFEYEGKLVAHRLTARRGCTIETCGDARPASPEYPDPQMLVGKVVAVRADESASAPRIDSTVFRLRGLLYARTRKARALAGSLSPMLCRMWAALPWRRKRLYDALFVLTAAAERNDRWALAQACSTADPAAVAPLVRRHGCSGVIVNALAAFDVTGGNAQSLRAVLQPHGRDVVLLTLAARQRLNEVIRVLDQERITFALLKGAARLYRDEPGAWLVASGDFDILVPSSQLDRAVYALKARGYDDGPYRALRSSYRQRHHHAAPLLPPGGGFAVELHIALAPPGTLSTPLDWDALRTRMERVSGSQGEVFCLDAYAAALHLAVHSLGLRRLRDTLLLARALAKLDAPSLAALRRVVAAERTDPVRLGAAFVLAARMAGLDWPATPDERAYLRWVARREDIPLYFAQRSQLAEGWYASRRRPSRLAWRMIDPSAGVARRSHLQSLHQLAGRILTGTCTLAYAALMRPCAFEETL
jgi:hypothetical protein